MSRLSHNSDRGGLCTTIPDDFLEGSIVKDDGVKWRCRGQGHPEATLLIISSAVSQVIEGVEARVGIEPTHKGFADLSLTAWVPRHLEHCTAGPGRNRVQLLRLSDHCGSVHRRQGSYLERETGVEPATLALARRCSTTELLPHYVLKQYIGRFDTGSTHAPYSSTLR